MAARVEGYTTTTAVLGNTRVMKVREWQIYSEPSDVYFEIRARQQTTRDQVQTIANGVSAIIEQLLDAPDITDISWAQDVTQGGQLIGVFAVYWYLPEKDESGFVEIPYSRFTVNYVAEQILIDSGPGTFLLSPQ
jgi:hypothetical protein